MAEQNQDKTADNAIPPKVGPFDKKPAATDAAAQPPSRAPAAPAAAPQGAQQGAQRRTSRIPLTGAIPPLMAASPSPQPRTIRIKPVVPQAGLGSIPDGPRPPTEAQIQAAKAKTSRISLDAAIGADAFPAAAQDKGDAPKTIRLKRPTEMPTIKVATVPPPGAVAPGAPRSTTPIAPGAASDVGQTSRISEGPTFQENVPITQKRTIRVKRPAPIVVVGGEVGAQAAETPAAAAAAPDRAHWFFILAAVVAILAGLGLAVVFSSQIFGPNESMTALSIWPTGPDFPLPGTVTAQ